MTPFRQYLIKKSCFRIPIRAGIGLSIISWIVQKALRVSGRSPWLVNFTSRVLHGDKLKIEEDSDSVRLSLLASGGCYINASHGISIGKDTIFSYNVVIVSEDHAIGNLSDIPQSPPIRIGRACWIGANSTILPGIELGNNTVVGANSVVTKSFPEGNVVIGGVPAKIIRRLTPSGQ